MCLLESNARAEHSIAIHFQELSFRASARVSNPMPSSNTPPIAILGMANANTIKKCHSQTHQAPKNSARAGSSGATLITTTRTMSAAIKCQTPGRLQKRECRNHDRYCIRQRVNVPVPNWLACPVQCMSSAVQFPNWLLACLSSAVSPTGKGACPKLACLSNAVSKLALGLPVQCSFFRSNRYRKRLFPDWPFSPPQKNRRPRILRGQVACRNAVAFAV